MKKLSASAGYTIYQKKAEYFLLNPRRLLKYDMEIKYQVLTKEGLSLLDNLKSAAFLKPFYLAGGTGLALQLGHRKSLDFDFFTSKMFNPKDLIRKLEIVGYLEDIAEETNTLLKSVFSTIILSKRFSR